MKCIFLDNISQKRSSLKFLFLLVLLIVGCGSSAGDNPIPSDVDMKGIWHGTTNTNMFGELQTTFNLNQEGNEIKGTLQLIIDGEYFEDNDVSGSVSNSTVTVNAFFGLQGGGQIEFSFEGKVSNDTYSGDVKLFKNGTDTNQGGTFSLTKGPSTGPTDFNGEWEIYEEQLEGEYLYWQYKYKVTIKQTGTQAILSKDNEHMTCNVIAEDLVCEGTFSFPGDAVYTYNSYTLRYDDNNSLTGEADWTFNDYPGQSNLTTIPPEVGSICTYNLMDFTFQSIYISPCNSNSWGINRISYPVESGYGYTFRDIQPGCYDVQACEDAERCETRPPLHVDRGETLLVTFNAN